ncbi:MAG: response regulator [Puniceicoccaceae bacterium]|nr:MAG: response regulator [Puniceicoccaceae bacterium]
MGVARPPAPGPPYPPGATPGPGQPPPPRPPPARTSPPHPPQVLIVEDLAFNRLVLRGYLESLGCRVTDAATPEEARQAWIMIDFDAAFIDLHLGNAWGADLARTLASEAIRRPPPVLLAVTADVEAAPGANGPFAGVLAKPLSLETLASALAFHGLLQDSNSPPPPAPPPSGEAAPDLGSLRFMADNSPERLSSLTEDFFNDLDKELDALSASLAARSVPQAGECAHRVLSHLSLIRYRPALEAAGQLQNVIREQDWSTAAGAFDRLRSVILDMKAAVDRNLAGITG